MSAMSTLFNPLPFARKNGPSLFPTAFAAGIVPVASSPESTQRTADPRMTNCSSSDFLSKTTVMKVVSKNDNQASPRDSPVSMVTSEDTTSSVGSPLPSTGSTDTSMVSSSKKRKRSPRRGEQAADPTFRGIAFSLPVGESKPAKQVISRQYLTKEALNSRSRSFPPRSPLFGCDNPLQADRESQFDLDYYPAALRGRSPDTTTTTVLTDATEFVPRRKSTSSVGSKPSSKKVPPKPRASCGPRKQKTCACCGCTSTPLWRDIGKELPLCNACGIRWKKYGVVCDMCQYVPCKQERDSKICKRCGSLLPAPSKRMRVSSPGLKKAATTTTTTALTSAVMPTTELMTQQVM